MNSKPKVLLFVITGAWFLVSCSTSPPPILSTHDLISKAVKLIPESELSLIVDPFAVNPSYCAVVSNLTRGCTNDLQKLKIVMSYILNDLAITNNHTPGPYLTRLPNDAISQGSARCVDYTMLYMALTRSLGLPTYFVFVWEDQFYRVSIDHVFHTCVGYYDRDEKRWVLIDLVYSAFDIKHRDFKIYSDIQALGEYYGNLGGYYCQLASITSNSKDLQLSIENTEMALHFNYSPRYLANLARVYYALDQKKSIELYLEAERLYRKMGKIRSFDYSNVLWEIGYSYYGIKDYKHAKKYFLEYLKRDTIRNKQFRVFAKKVLKEIE